MGNWWRGYGYAGAPYCQRCSEVFRDHLIRQKPNSANCSRDDPCHDCAKLLENFSYQNGVNPPQHGISSNKMGLITSYCDAMHTHEHKMARITLEI